MFQKLCTQSDRSVYIYYPSNPDPKLGVFAVRWNQYKAHYYSNGYVYNMYVYSRNFLLSVQIFIVLLCVK